MIGDHIRALRGGRWVHGIDGGDGTVLHLGEGPGPRVLRTYRPLFVEGAEAVEVVTHREPVFPPKSVVARAFGPLRDPALAGMFADSEAFARWCKSGRMPEVPSSPALAAQAEPRPAAGGTVRVPGRETPSRRSPSGKRPAARAPGRKASARKAPGRKKKAPAGRAAARKAPARKAAPRKGKSASRKRR